jgi:Rne/Rng family ribonuclease
MKKSLIISEQDNIAALLENDRVVEFFVNRGELLLGDIYTATVENILPGIDAAFVNLGKDKMGFLHANDVPGQGLLRERLVPKQKLLVQITKEPTGHKGPRVSTAISLPGRFLVLVPEERSVSISRKISDAKERARLKSVVGLLKPPGVGLIIRTEAKGQGEQELFEDFETLWDRWQSIVSNGESSIGPSLVYRDQDLLYRVLRDAYSSDMNEIITDTPDGQRRAIEFLSGWASRQTQIMMHADESPLLVARGIDHEIAQALSDRVELPSGGHLVIQPTEALTVIDVNSGRFTSSRTQAETVRRTNVEAAQEIPRQLRLRNIGGMVIVDFIDMDSRKDQQQVLEVFQRHLEEDRAKPQVGQLSDLGLVELTRRRQGQSLRELFTTHCHECAGLGVMPTLEIGGLEGRRLIAMKPTDEELSLNKGRSGAKRSGPRPGTVLRSASISQGRVQPTSTQAPIEESAETELLDVPLEILEQMPDDLLDRPKKPFNAPEDEEGDSELESEGTSTEHRPQGLVESFTNSDDTEEDSSGHLSNIVENAELVLQDLNDSKDSPNYFRSELALNNEIDETETESETPELESFNYEVASPVAAEPDSIAGVFRLKSKSHEESNEQPNSSLDYSPSSSNPSYSPASLTNSYESGAIGEDGSNGTNSIERTSGEQNSFVNNYFNEQSNTAWWQEQASTQLELPLAETKEDEQ